MADDTISKVSLESAPTGAMGQKYLASGANVALRLWEEGPEEGVKPPSTRDYETVGYVVAGQAEVQFGGKTLTLEQGDSWVVPKGVPHTYKILAPFTAIEATSPPARDGRDAPTS